MMMTVVIIVMMMMMMMMMIVMVIMIILMVMIIIMTMMKMMKMHEYLVLLLEPFLLELELRLPLDELFIELIDDVVLHLHLPLEV